MPRNRYREPPNIVRVVVWLIVSLSKLISQVRRKLVEWGCTHDFKIISYAKGNKVVFYIEQCARCELTPPIASVDYKTWEQIRLDKYVKKNTPLLLENS